MVVPKGSVAGPDLKFEAEYIGVTPDGEWTWYHVSAWNWKKMVRHVIGVIAESPDLTYFGTEETYRRYTIIFYEPSEYGEGSMPMTTARSFDDAVTMVIEQWDKRNQIARRAKASSEADCTDSEIRGN
jgi:hypothetical protein